MADSKGSCMCGEVSFTLQGQPSPVITCYCDDCRKNAGGPFQIFAGFSGANVKVEDPNKHQKVYTILNTSSGKPKEKHFCDNCGCTLWTIPMSFGGDVTLVRTSLIEDGLAKFPPTEELFKPS